MNKHGVLSTVLLVSSCLISVPESKAQDCSFPPKALAEGQHREYRDRYENRAYGYSVVIPRNLVGYEGVNPGYQNGFGMLSGSEPQSYVFVNGEPNSLEFARPADAAARFVDYLRAHGSRIESSKITDTQLGGLNAALLVATYTCSGSAEPYVRASVVAISADKSMLYEVTLFAHSARFEQDRALFDALVRSWKHLGA